MNQAEELHELRATVAAQKQRIKRLKVQRDKARLARQQLALKTVGLNSPKIVSLTLLHPETLTGVSSQYVSLHPGGPNEEVELTAQVLPSDAKQTPYRVTARVVVSLD
jgi:septal ring factor EnvC (AmiA/AmiB activator)